MDSRLQRTRSSSIACDLNHQPSAVSMVARPKPKNFYRFIGSNEISITIPNKFTREHRKNILLNNVLIIVSDDKVWPLGWMISDDGNLCLQQGWPEFAEHYRLKRGYLLLFNHHGKSVFHVRIFDRNSCEISYAPPTIHPKSENQIHQPVTEDDQVQSMSMAETKVLHTPSIFQEIKEKGNDQRSRNRALESAKSFKSNNPFFSVAFKVSYFKWGLYVPTSFLRRYLLSGDEKCGNCVLEASDGRNWGPIKCRDYENYGKLYGSNWNTFRDENHLGVGDVCALELINVVEKVLKVTIFRACQKW